jgi:putative transcriptional regulator
MTITRHPDALNLMSFAAGTLGEPLAAIVAGHLSECGACRAEVADLDEMGAVLLDTASASPATTMVPPRRPESSAMLARPTSPETARDSLLPPPLARRWALTHSDVPWQPVARGIRQHRLALSPGATGDLRLLEVAPGVAIPDHGHHGAEMTLVLLGGFHDLTGHYGPGDVEDVDEEVVHRPEADSDGCICLVASEGPPRFTGLGMRLVQALRRR